MHHVNRWTDAVWEADMEPMSKLIALHLRSYMNERNEEAYPSIETIREKCGIKSSNTVRTHLGKLVAAGWLGKTKKTSCYRTIIYRATFPSEAEQSTTEPSTIKPSTIKPSTIKPSTIKPSTIKPSTIEPSTLQPLSIYPSTIEAELNKVIKQVIKQPNNALFEKFWNAGLTKKGNKGKAEKVFNKLLEQQPHAEDFTARLVLDISTRRAAGQFGFDKLHPLTYLNGERWNDELDSPSEDEPREVMF